MKLVFIFIFLAYSTVNANASQNGNDFRKCRIKHRSKQEVLKCLIYKQSPNEIKKYGDIEIKIYEVDFPGFGTGQILYPKSYKKNIVLEYENNYYYGSSIYNSKSCCNSNEPVLIIERYEIQNSSIHDCNGKCPSSSTLYAYRLKSPNSPPAIIDLNPNFTNQLIFGPLVSHDLSFVQDSLVWDANRSSFSATFSFLGPAEHRFPVTFELSPHLNSWTVYIDKRD